MKATEFCRIFALGLLLLVLVPNTQGCTDLICWGHAVDIVFVLDSSTSIWKVYFQQQLDFVKKMSDCLNIGMGTNQVRVGVETFSDDVYSHTFLSDSKNSQSLKKEIEKIHYKTGSTNIGAALKLLLSTMFTENRGSRANVQNVAIILTDGASQDPQATQAAAKQCREANIKLIVIEIGDYVKPSELRGIASKPYWKYLFKMKNDTSERIIRDILQLLCEKVTPMRPNPIISTTPTPDNCNHNQRIDVVFMVSNNHFGKVKTDRILRASAEVIRRVGTSRYFQFGTIFDKCLPKQDVPVGLVVEESRIVNFNTGSVASLIHKLRKEMFTSQLCKVHQAGLLFLDHSIDLTDPEILEEVKRAKIHNINLYPVIIGSHVNGELVEKSIATKEHIIEIDYYSNIKDDFPSKFIKKMCKQFYFKPGIC